MKAEGKTQWPVNLLGEVAIVGAGNSAPQKDELFQNGTIPFFRTSDAGRIRFGDIFESEDFLNDLGAKGLRRYPVGTILFPKSGASTFLNHRVMLGVEGCVSSHLATIIANPERIHSRFLLYFLSTVESQDLVQDHAYPSLNLPTISGIEVPIPPLPEQERIVGILDEAFDGIAKAKATAEANLQNARALFQSHLQSVFSQRGEGWAEKRLGEVCSIARGGSPRPIQKYITTDPSGINWVKIGDATASGKYIFTTQQKIIPEGAKRSRLVKEGDFLLSNSMSFGRPYIMKTTGCIHDGWLVLTDYSASLEQDYLYYILGSDLIYQQFDRLAAGSTVRNLNIDLASKVVIPIPSLKVQKSVVDKIEHIAEETQRLESLYQNKLNALDELKKSLLHQAFTGNL